MSMVVLGCRCIAITAIAGIETRIMKKCGLQSVLVAALLCSSNFAVHLHCKAKGQIVDTPEVCVAGAGTDFILPATLPLPATCEVVARSTIDLTKTKPKH